MPLAPCNTSCPFQICLNATGDLEHFCPSMLKVIRSSNSKGRDFFEIYSEERTYEIDLIDQIFAH